MNDIEKRIREILNEDVPPGNKPSLEDRLTQLYHQLLLEDRKRLIGVVENLPAEVIKEVVPYNKDGNLTYGQDEVYIKRSAILTTLNKEKD